MQKIADMMPRIKHLALTYDELLKAKSELCNSTPGKLTG